MWHNNNDNNHDKDVETKLFLIASRHTNHIGDQHLYPNATNNDEHVVDGDADDDDDGYDIRTSLIWNVILAAAATAH